MLQDYCDSLPDDKQVNLYLALFDIIIPVWDKYMESQPDAINTINALITDSNRVKNSNAEIDKSFLKNSVRDVNNVHRGDRDYKSSDNLNRCFATIMQPITNPDWDDTMEQTPRLIYTSVFNLLTFLLLRRENDEDETHIYGYKPGK